MKFLLDLLAEHRRTRAIKRARARLANAEDILSYGRVLVATYEKKVRELQVELYTIDAPDANARRCGAL